MANLPNHLQKVVEITILLQPELSPAGKLAVKRAIAEELAVGRCIIKR